MAINDHLQQNKEHIAKYVLFVRTTSASNGCKRTIWKK